MTMTIDDFIKYAQSVPTQYKIPEDQGYGGYIPLEHRAWINPNKPEQEQVVTFVHELLHHHYETIGEDVHETEIERQAQDFYARHRLLCHKVKMYNLDCNTLENIAQDMDANWD